MSKEAKNNKETKNNKDKRHFLKDFKAELKKVIWPTPKQLVNNTVAVITIVLITAVVVFVLDLAFETLTTYGVGKLRTAVESSVKNEESNGIVNEQANTVDTNRIENTESSTSEDANVQE